ncbi:hypothetical protein GALMADRAFT_237772 [Galerina marginata CBS 339.88]|uniref:Uncharacterized protein n=1 Tax=Galerina marginata (strain CBS 339.88) TaxID=685588 RepID=A0A067TH62_GALM3|nr:hypothetical protein GALMADRAFT_237772 [Galerina marginata CBS 339.88]
MSMFASVVKAMPRRSRRIFLLPLLVIGTVLLSLTYFYDPGSWSAVAERFPLGLSITTTGNRTPPSSTTTTGLVDEEEEVLVVDPDYPPSYRALKKQIQDLPQHNLDLPFPEGRNGRYVKFSSEIQLLGWNNVLNERLMDTYLAYKSNRAYVFADYIWKEDYYPWPKEKAIEWPPITPLPALISGPSVGGSWGPNDPAPRSISEKWYEVVCPPERRRIINTHEVKPALVNETGSVVFATWQKILLDAPESCIEIQPASREEDSYPQVFDLWVWGSWKVLSLWDVFSKSPVSQLLGVSPTIERLVESNKAIFMEPKNTATGEEVVTVDPFSRMLAIHLRRGDFKQACLSLSNWNSTFYSWNLLDFLPDKFTPPPGGGWGTNTPENEALYMKHCLPSDEEILQKIRDSRTEYLKAVEEQGRKETLDVLFLLTNDKSGWLDEVKKIMMADGWKVVATSHDLVLDREGKDVAMALDMELARKASVFIGNGWSSFTSNIVHRRLVDGRIPMSNRFY